MAIQLTLCESSTGKPFQRNGSTWLVPFGSTFTIDLVNFMKKSEGEVKLEMSPNVTIGTFVVGPKTMFSIRRAVQGDASFKVERSRGWQAQTQTLTATFYERIDTDDGNDDNEVETDGPVGTVVVPGRPTGQRFSRAFAKRLVFLHQKEFIIQGV
ncbi:unknown protein [Grouper iridovirus]|uniref:Uncharacterized protein n=1 Tax=Grouper iridovirus TaxID=127569 RepID=Q5GAG8_9VIRU|nr:unknown protein [Grouper iridovirus]